MTRLHFVLLLVGALVLGACGKATEPPPPPPPPDPPQPVSKVIGSEGGVVSGEGYESWRFALTVPQDARADAATITVTPLETLDGFDFSEQLTLQVCLGEFSPCTLGLGAPVTIVPDLRGTWYGTGTLYAHDCRSDDDDGQLDFSNWQATFTQSISAQQPPQSDFRADFTGSGIGVRLLAPLVGTMGSLGEMQGTAAYQNPAGTTGGEATFQGGFDVFEEGYETVILDFDFHDTRGDTCVGTGRVTFRKLGT
ncbi:MAG: hypothetical protein AB1730_22865 [Myxococcota bacterium]